MRQFDRIEYICDQLDEMGLKDAERFTSSNDFTLRVVKKDGQPCIITCDYRLDRINVEIQDGIIVTVSGIG